MAKKTIKEPIRRLHLVLVEADRLAEKAYWLMRSTNKELADELGITDKIKEVIASLNRADKLTIDAIKIIHDKIQTNKI